MILKREKLKNKVQLFHVFDRRVLWLAKHYFKISFIFLLFCLHMYHKREV